MNALKAPSACASSEGIRSSSKRPSCPWRCKTQPDSRRILQNWTGKKASSCPRDLPLDEGRVPIQFQWTRQGLFNPEIKNEHDVPIRPNKDIHVLVQADTEGFHIDVEGGGGRIGAWVVRAFRGVVQK